MNKAYDSVIVGAGLVGALGALILAQQGYHVLLIEKNPPRNLPAMADRRTMALSAASVRYLKAWHIWQHVALKAAPIESVCVTQKGQYGSTQLASPILFDVTQPLGQVVSVVDLDAASQIEIANNPHIDFWQPASLCSHRPLDNGWELMIHRDGTSETLHTKLLIAADGALSPLAKANHIVYQSKAYSHHAITANVTLETKTPHVAYERFLEKGAIALLPWLAPYATCVWTIEDEPSAYLALSDEAYIQACQEAFGRRVGRIIGVGKRMAFPLNMHIAKKQTSWRFCVIGNAAHQLHPIAAQGLNISVQDLGKMWQLLRDHHPEDIGDPTFLANYQNSIQSRQTAVMQTTDKIADWLASSKLPGALRGIGIALFDSLPPLKRKMVEWGTGQRV